MCHRFECGMKKCVTWKECENCNANNTRLNMGQRSEVCKFLFFFVCCFFIYDGFVDIKACSCQHINTFHEAVFGI